MADPLHHRLHTNTETHQIVYILGMKLVHSKENKKTNSLVPVNSCPFYFANWKVKPTSKTGLLMRGCRELHNYNTSHISKQTVLV